MKNKNIIRATILMLFAVSFKTQAQGYVDGFFSEVGALSVTTTYTRGSFEQFYFGEQKRDLNDEEVTPFSELTQDIYSVYAKYEIATDLVTYINVPFVVGNGGGVTDPINNETSVSGIQDVSLGLKYRLKKYRFENSHLSILSALTIEIPGDYEPNGILSIGSGSMNADFTGGLHYNTNSGFFTTLLGSYSFRDDLQSNGDFNVPNAVVGTAKVGYANSFFYIDGWIDHISSTSGVDIGGAGFAGNFPETKVQFTKVGATLYKKFNEQFGLSAGAGTIIDGRNVGKSTTFSIGLTYDIQLL